MDFELAHLKFRLGNRNIVREVFKELKPRLKLHKYFDPKQSRTAEDFEQVAFFATYEAMNTYDAGLGPFIPWVIRIVRSHLAAEVKKITRELNPDLSFDWVNDDDEGSSDYIEGQIDQNKSYSQINPMIADKIYEEYLEQVRSVLRRSTNTRLIQVFNMKMMFPHWKSRDIANRLQVSVAIISQCMTTIHMAIRTVAQDHTESYRETGI